MSEERKKSAWAMAVSQHMKAGGNFPRKGSADYDAVMKIKEKMSGAKPATKSKNESAVIEPKPKKQTGRDKEIERLGEEIRMLKDKLGGEVKHSVRKDKNELSICHDIPLAKITKSKKSKIPIGDEDE